MTDKKTQARDLYMNGSCTQRQIAEQLSVSERTVYTWIKDNAWDRLRQAALAAPLLIADNLCSQLVEMQNAISARESGQRFPTPQEAEVTRKLITGIEKMKKFPSLAQNMQMFQTFKQFIRPNADDKFYRKLNRYFEDYVEAEAKNGYFPYQVEYGVTRISPLPPGGEEDEGEEISPEPETPKPSFDLTHSFALPQTRLRGEGRGEVSPQPGLHPTACPIEKSEETGSFPEVLPPSPHSTSPSPLGEGRGEATHGKHAQPVDDLASQPTSGYIKKPEEVGSISEAENPQPSFDLTLSFSEGRGEVSPQPDPHLTSDPIKKSEETGSFPEVENPQPSFDLALSFGEGRGEAQAEKPTQPAPTKSETFLKKKFPTRLFALRGENIPPRK